jgi:leucyl-tRNA synthetase
LLFSEVEVLTLLIPYIKKNLKMQDVNVMTVDEGKKAASAPEVLLDQAEPGTPAFNFFNPE